MQLGAVFGVRHRWTSALRVRHTREEELLDLVHEFTQLIDIDEWGESMNRVQQSRHAIGLNLQLSILIVTKQTRTSNSEVGLVTGAVERPGVSRLSTSG